jgi:hypothetical protein
MDTIPVDRSRPFLRQCISLYLGKRQSHEGPIIPTASLLTRRKKQQPSMPVSLVLPISPTLHYSYLRDPLPISVGENENVAVLVNPDSICYRRRREWVLSKRNANGEESKSTWKIASRQQRNRYRSPRWRWRRNLRRVGRANRRGGAGCGGLEVHRGWKVDVIR